MAPGFEPVLEAFQRNFDARGELGAAFSAYRGGESIVDLWGGVVDPASGRAWASDSLQLMFSGTKGLVAGCVLMLVDRGALGLDDPVARHWPEFGANGKDQILVRDVLGHTARLPGVVTPLTFADLTDAGRVAALLASQAPSRDPRAPHVYHGLTYGWLCGELVRRIDGRTVGRFFHDEFAVPLELELWIGLPAREEHRVTTLVLDDDWGASGEQAASAAEDDFLAWSVWGNPPLFDRDAFQWNSRSFHASELPGANAIGTARAMARFYDALGSLLSAPTLALAAQETSRRVEPFLGEEIAYGAGFHLQTPLMALGPPGDAFGHLGAGGSAHGRWPTEGIGFSYAMNLMRDREIPDPRSDCLLAALYDCAGA